MAEDFGSLFDAAAPTFTLCSSDLWYPAGDLAVEAAALEPGDRVLDVCCGAGASAIPAARQVGPTGRVRAVDLSNELLVRAREAAEEQGLDGIDFRRGDGTDPEIIGSGYDAVICVYGVFFFEDMEAGGRTLLHAARPGGRFVVGAWGRNALGRLTATLATALEPLRPEVAAGLLEYTSPSMRIETADTLAEWLEELGGVDTVVREHPRTVPLGADLAWALVTGSAMRVVLTGMGPDELEQVREGMARAVLQAPTLCVDTVIGVTHRPARDV